MDKDELSPNLMHLAILPDPEPDPWTVERIVGWLRERALGYREQQRGYDRLSHGHILNGDMDRAFHEAANAIAAGEPFKESSHG